MTARPAEAVLESMLQLAAQTVIPPEIRARMDADRAAAERAFAATCSCGAESEAHTARQLDEPCPACHRAPGNGEAVMAVQRPRRSRLDVLVELARKANDAAEEMGWHATTAEWAGMVDVDVAAIYAEQAAILAGAELPEFRSDGQLVAFVVDGRHGPHVQTVASDLFELVRLARWLLWLEEPAP